MFVCERNGTLWGPLLIQSIYFKLWLVRSDIRFCIPTLQKVFIWDNIFSLEVICHFSYCIFHQKGISSYGFDNSTLNTFNQQRISAFRIANSSLAPFITKVFLPTEFPIFLWPILLTRYSFLYNWQSFSGLFHWKKMIPYKISNCLRTSIIIKGYPPTALPILLWATNAFRL